MERALVLAAFSLFLSAAGCGAVEQAAARGGAATEPQDTRGREEQALSLLDARSDAELARLEERTLLALRLTSGQVTLADYLPVPQAAPQTILALRRTSVKLRLVPLANTTDLVDLEDSAKDRIATITRKLSDHTATAAEAQEAMEYERVAFALTDLRIQVREVAAASTAATSFAQSAARTTEQRALNGAELAVVRRALLRQARADALAATTLALLAAYEAAINDGADPTAIEIIAKGGVQAFPLQTSISDDDARGYVASLAKTPPQRTFSVSAKNADAEKNAKNVDSKHDPVLSGDTTLSLQGVAALKRGDARGALNAASTFAPVTTLKDTFAAASRVLFRDPVGNQGSPRGATR